MLNLAVKKNFEKNLPLKVYGNLNQSKLRNCNIPLLALDIYPYYKLTLLPW